MKRETNNKLKHSQVIALSPNGLRHYSATLPSLNKATYFAFGCESLIYIYDRSDFSRIIISTPDPTSPVVSLTFAGTFYLFCSNKMGILYAYSRKSLISEPLCSHNIGCIPSSMTASNRHLFYINDHKLFCFNIDDFFAHKEPGILNSNEGHTELKVSPYGRAVATYTYGGKTPEVWFSPFQKKLRFQLPIFSNVIDFQWGLSESLICITATEDGLIRVWVEQSDALQMRQSYWFHFDSPIIYISFCIPTDEHNQPQFHHEAQSTNPSIFPCYKCRPFFLMVGLKNGESALLKESFQPELFQITKFFLKNSEERSLTFTDYRDSYSEYQIKMFLTVTQFSMKSLDFYHIELGDSNVIVSLPYKVSFMQSHVKSIESNDENHIITKMRDGMRINWNKNIIQEDETNFIFHKGEIFVTKDGRVCYNKEGKEFASIDLGFIPLFYIFNIQNNQLMGILSNNDTAVVLFYFPENGRFSTFQFDEPPHMIIKNAAFHSTDLIAIASNNTIKAYIFQNGIFVKFASLFAESKYILFLPKLLFAVAQKKSISFYSLSSGLFEKIISIDSTHITAINYIRDSLVVATKHSLFRMLLPKELFPLPLKLSDNYVFLTMLSLCHFSVVQDFLNDREPTLESFVKRIEAESFTFSPINQVKIRKIPYFSEFLEKLPKSWTNVDSNGMKFVFSFTLVKVVPQLKKHLPLLSIWALLSTDQSNLTKILNFKSINDICESYLPLWIKNHNVLIQTMTDFLSNNLPSADEFDTFVLFCIAMNKKTIASKLATRNGNIKLSEFLKNLDATSSKIENSAFKAQQQHRFSLAAMFFYLRGMKKQAVIVLHEEPLLMILFARLIEFDEWKLMIDDQFYKNWWDEKNDAMFEYITNNSTPTKNDADNYIDDFNSNYIDAVNYKNIGHVNDNYIENVNANQIGHANVSNDDVILIEAHKFEILKILNYSKNRRYILDLQKIPFLIFSYLKSSSNLITQQNANVITQNISVKDGKSVGNTSPQNSNGKKVELEKPPPKTKTAMEFSFGGGWDDIEIDDFEDEYEYEKEDKSKGNDNNNEDLIFFADNSNEGANDSNINANQQNEEFIEFESNFSDMFLVDCFESIHTDYISTSEEYIVALLSELYNMSYSENTIKYLLDIAKELALGKLQLHVITAILFSVTYSLSEFTWMSPIIQQNFDPSFVINALEHFSDVEIKVSKSLPDFVSFLSLGAKSTESDKELSCFVAFDQMLSVFKDLTPHGEVTMFTYFLHHRHNYMFSKLKKCSFSAPEIQKDLHMFGIHSNKYIQRMQNSRANEKIMVALNDEFLSPFFVDNTFEYTSSYNVKTTSARVFDVCINSCNNHSIALAANEVIETIISQAQLDGKGGDETYSETIDEWDIIMPISPSKDDTTSGASSLAKEEFKSPLLSCFHPKKIVRNTFKYPVIRPLSIKWPKADHPSSNVKAKCICSHPKKEIFVSGDATGALHLWKFNKFMNENNVYSGKSSNTVKFHESRITSLCFNECGDRIASVDIGGKVVISDFVDAQSFNVAPECSFQWLNNDTQLICVNPKESKLYIYDILAGNDPVAMFPLNKSPQETVPLARCDSCVVTGFNDGTSIVFDVRSGLKIANLNLHTQPIRSIKYDQSGSFFVTGGMDNQITVVEAKTFNGLKPLYDVLPNYNPNSDKRGIFSIAVSKQAILACGYSSFIHVWTKTGVV